MAVQPDQKDFYTFVAGLNSEAGWFTAPPNTWKNGDNMVPQIDGILYKRKALDYEANRELFTVPSATANDDDNWAYTVGYWDAVNGDGDNNILVVQVGKHIYFYEAIGGTVSGRKYSFTIDLSGNDSDGNVIQPVSNTSTIGTNPIRCITAAGKLIIVSQDTEPLLVTFVDESNITYTKITLQFRDFIGVEDGFEVDENPSGTLPLFDVDSDLDGELDSYSPAAEATRIDWWKHEYNLRNQGWGDAQLTTYRATGSSPSNAQSWIYGKNTDDNFDAALLDKQDFGTSPAAKGRFILDAFSRNRSDASGVSAAYVPTEVEDYRPATCAFFAGRAWYAGVRNSSLLSNYVFFSKVASDPSKLGQCYQEQDPTSEVLNDLVDSDGGIVSIQDCGEIVHLLATANGILVFASNGLWKIAGTANSGFAATGYEVTKISAVGCVGPRTVVVTDGGVFYWSYNGIYALEPTQTGTSVTIVNYSDTVIKNFYGGIPSLGKKYSEGVYNPGDKTVVWMYTDDLISDDGISNRYRKNKALVFDVRLKAFYTLSFSSLATNSPYVVAPAVTKETGELTQEFGIIANNGDVVYKTITTEPLVVNQEVANNGAASIKFVTTRFASGALTVSFADMLTEEDAPARFTDWYSVDNVGANYDAYIETSYVPGPTGFSKNMQSLYVTTFMNRTETGIVAEEPVNTSSCLMRGKWEFSDSTNSNKWGPQQQIYRIKRLWFDDDQGNFTNGFPLVVAKSKVRGRGKALQLRFDSEAGTDCQLAGWSVQQLGNTNV